MENSPIINANRLANAADDATNKGDFLKASELYHEAAQKYAGAVGTTDDQEAEQAIKLLRKEFLRLAKESASRDAALKTHNNTPHRLVKENIPRSRTNTTHSSVIVARENGDTNPIQKTTSSMAAFSQFYDRLPSNVPRATAFATVPLEASVRPEESYYIVPNRQKGLDAPSRVGDLAAENKQLRHVIDSVAKRQQPEYQNMQAELNLLRAETTRLEEQNAKYRERWEKLKEGAKKRRAADTRAS